MANINRIVLAKNGIDEVHYKTNAGQVVTADGDTVENKINTINDKIANCFYSAIPPSEAKENDIWYQTEKSVSPTPTQTFTYKNSVQQFNVPEDGLYGIKCYGARGGYRNYSSTTYAGKGGIVYGTVNLKKGDTLYIYTGQNGNVDLGDSSYTFNGGGKGAAACQCGGGATDVRLVGGNWDDEASLLSRIIVAGGGGSCGGTTKQGGNSGTAATSGYGTGGHAGSQTAGGTGSTTDTSTRGYFGKGGHGVSRSSGYGGAGGGGWYGGAGTYPNTSLDDDKGGGGGSNYIYTSSSTKPSGYSPDTRFYFTNTSTTTSNSEVDGKVEIFGLVESIIGTFVYKDGEWSATASKVDTDSIMNTDTYSKLSTTNKTIVGAINEVFQSVSSGKSSIAKAITSKGVTASASDTFNSLANKINLIKVKKYDTGETLTKGTHFEFATSFGPDDFYARYPNINGNVLFSSKEILITDLSASNYNVYYYYDYEDSFQFATSLYSPGDLIGVVGQYGVTLRSDNSQDLMQLGFLNPPPSIPDSNIIPGYYKIDQKNYFYEHDNTIYLLTVSICDIVSGEGLPPMPPCVLAQCYKFNGSTFVIDDYSTVLNLSISTSDLSSLEFRFSIDDDYLAIAHTSSNYSGYDIEVFSRMTYTKEYSISTHSSNLDAFCLAGYHLIYSYDNNIYIAKQGDSYSRSIDSGLHVAASYDGKLLYDKNQMCVYCLAVDNRNSLNQILKIDLTTKNIDKYDATFEKTEYGTIIADKRYSCAGQVEDYSMIILK